MKKPRGRPKKDAGLEKEAICRAALAILDKFGPDGLSLRRLAGDLNVTPMALYNYFPNRTSLLRSVADFTCRGIAPKESKAHIPPQTVIKQILTSYYQEILRHPNLSLSIFATPEAFSQEAHNITEKLKRCLKESKLTPARRERWLDILVDFTHGSSIATAVGLASGQLKHGSKQFETYKRELDELLSCIYAKPLPKTIINRHKTKSDTNTSR